jgi:hypothetical protein
MRTSGENAETVDAYEACAHCDFSGPVDLHLNHATRSTWWECPSGHTNEGES